MPIIAIGLAALAILTIGITMRPVKLPFDNGHAITAARSHLREITADQLDPHIQLTTDAIVERNDEAVLSSSGTSLQRRNEVSGLALIQKTKIQYLAIVTRECARQNLSCYTVRQMSGVGETNVSPRL
jgi:hypothetical protein